MIPILHISDMHIGEKDDFPIFRYERIADVVQSTQEPMDALLIITGDIASSGKVDEYDMALKAISTIKEGFAQKGYILHIFLVPGNHDIAFPLPESPNEKFSFSTIEELKGSASHFELYKKLLELMEGFHLFASSFDLFEDEFVSSRLLPISSTITLEITMLNSAPYSTLKADNKELHYLPQESLKHIEKTSGENVKLVLVHHGPEWFEPNTKNRLESLLYKHCDILFVGHEHICRFERNQRDNGSELAISRAGMINHNDYDSSTFMLYWLDPELLKISGQVFEWDPSKALYSGKRCITHQIIPKNPWSLQPLNEYTLKEDSIFEMSIEDIFVFPDLSVEGFSEEDMNYIVGTEDELLRLIEDKRIICINGRPNSGKTTLLRRMYKRCIAEGFSPLYLSKKNNMKSNDRLFDTLISEQYGADDASRSMFMQVDKGKRILFIDDFDQLREKDKSQSAFFTNALIVADHIVFVSGLSQSADIVELLKKDIDDKQAIFSLNLKDFYKEKREALIRKVCKAKNSGNDVADALVINIDKVVHSHRFLCDLNPDFIIQNVIYRLENTAFMFDDDIPFGKIYDFNLRTKMRQSYRHISGCDKEVLIKTTLRVLQSFAYEMHKKRNDMLPIDRFTEIGEEFIRANELSISGITERALLEMAIQSDVLSFSEDLKTLEFRSLNYLAYFVAKELDTRIKRDMVDVRPDLEYLLRNICFDVNSAILLFLSILREDIEFPIRICEMLESILKDIPAFSFDEKNIGFMCNKPHLNLRMVEEEDKTIAHRAITTAEEERDLKELEKENVYRRAYDYNENLVDEPGYVFLKAIKYIELIGKAYRAHYVDLPKESKHQMASALYQAPNQIIFSFLSELDSDQAIDELHEFFLDSFPESAEELTRERVSELVNQFGFIFCLSMYEQATYSASQRSTCEALVSCAPGTTNGRIQSLFVLAHGGTTERFMNEAFRLFTDAKKANNAIVMLYVKGIVNWYVANHTLDGKTIQTIRSSQLFTEKQHKTLLQTNYKRKKEEADEQETKKAANK